MIGSRVAYVSCSIFLNPRLKPLQGFLQSESSTCLQSRFQKIPKMAFANRIGTLFKQAVSSNPSVDQAIRCMSSSRLFVGGISYATDDQTLREAFSSFGEVAEARIIMDRETGRSRGFGFVSFTSTEEASNAISGMDGKDLQGRIIRVNYATERTGGFRSGGGSYGSYGGGAGSSYTGGSSNYGSSYGGASSNFGGDGYNAGGGGGYDTGTGSNGGDSNSRVAGGSDGYFGGSTDNSYASTGQDDDAHANRRG